MVSIKNKRSTFEFLKKVCKEIEQPFTIFDLTEKMHGQRYNFPTTTELKHLLTKMTFIEVVGKTATCTGKTSKYIYVGE